MIKALILAGGKGARLRPLALHTPKPIVPLANIPFLFFQIDVRAFHDAVLDQGPLPLDVLETKISEWIKERK